MKITKHHIRGGYRVEYETHEVRLQISVGKIITLRVDTEDDEILTIAGYSQKDQKVWQKLKISQRSKANELIEKALGKTL